MLGTHTMISTGPIFAMVAFIFLTAPTAVKCDWPPLHKAAYEGDVATAKALVSSGALLNQKDFKYVLYSPSAAQLSFNAAFLMHSQ
jgi:hypothetical protein